MERTLLTAPISHYLKRFVKALSGLFKTRSESYNRARRLVTVDLFDDLKQKFNIKIGFNYKSTKII
jgi:hypothetical protein